MFICQNSVLQSCLLFHVQLNYVWRDRGYLDGIFRRELLRIKNQRYREHFFLSWSIIKMKHVPAYLITKVIHLNGTHICPKFGPPPEQKKKKSGSGWTCPAASYQIHSRLILKLFLISAGGKHFLSFFQLLRAKSELRPVYLMRTQSSLLTALWNSLSALWPWMWMENLWGVLCVASSSFTDHV